MRFISYCHNQQISWGALTDDDRVVDLSTVAVDMKQAIAEQALDQIVLAQHSHRLALSEVELMTPIQFPEKILCIGVNYANRNAEYKDGSDEPEYPSVFIRTPDSLTAHQQPLIRPPESDRSALLERERPVRAVGDRLGPPAGVRRHAHAWA